MQCFRIFVFFFLPLSSANSVYWDDFLVGRLAVRGHGAPRWTALFTVPLSREFISTALVVENKHEHRQGRKRNEMYLFIDLAETDEGFFWGAFCLYIDVANVCSMVTLIISCIFNHYDDKILMTMILLLLVLSSCEEAGRTQQKIGAAVVFLAVARM